MGFHKVEVDDEVFQYVKKQAEPLVDTFNSVLRRLLLASGPKIATNKQKKVDNYLDNSLILNLPRQIPESLRHILEVIYLVRGGAYDRPSATHFVAKKHNVFPQTVQDKYCRQLNLRAREFDRLLESPDLKELKKMLILKFPDYEHVINDILN